MTQFDTLPSVSLSHAPVIGISPTTTKASYLSLCAVLHHAGVQPVMLEHDPALLAEQLQKIDGVIAMGNPWDIDPNDYGKPDVESRIPEQGTAEYDAYLKKTIYETALVQEAMAQKIPLLGICGGHQRINVTVDKDNPALKAGTLHTIAYNLAEHPEEEHEIDFNARWPYTPVHLIKVEPNTSLDAISQESKQCYSPLAEYMPEGVHLINSIHKQAVDEVREGFRVAARAADGTIEAIEADQSAGTPYAGQYVLGVQWHPEFGESALGRAIISDFVSHAREHQRNHGNMRYAEEIYRAQLPDYLQQLLASSEPHTAIQALFAQSERLSGSAVMMQR